MVNLAANHNNAFSNLARRCEIPELDLTREKYRLMEHSDQRPTRVRYGVMGYLASLSFILYIDRICIGQAAESIMKELEITKSQFSWVLIAFQVAYGIFEPTTGHWGDRYGSRKVLIRIVLWWSIFTALTGTVFKFSVPITAGIALNGLTMLFVIRFLFGAGEAGAFPNAARIISTWFPPGNRGPAQALISVSAQVGAAAAPVLAAAFIKSEQIGWRWAFVIFGSLGLVWCWFFAMWYRDDPSTHPSVNDAERRYIQEGRSLDYSTATHHRLPWAQVVSNYNLWILGVINACTSFYSYMLFSWFPTYLKDGRGLGEQASGNLGSLPYVFGAVGALFGGFLGDWMTRRVGSRRVALVSISSTCLLLSGVLVGCSVLFESTTISVLFCSLAYFFSYIQLPIWWAAVADIAGRYTGALFGLCNMIGLTGGAISQAFLPRFVEYREKLVANGVIESLSKRDQWDPAFLIYAAVLLVGGFLWLTINPYQKIVVPDEAAQD